METGELKFFRYNDFTFVPVRKFSSDEKKFVGTVLSDKNNEKLLSKNSLFYAGYLESKKPKNEQHFEKALKVFDEDAKKETAAVLFLAVNNIDKSPAVMEANGRYAVYHKGIKTLIGKDKDGKYVVSGFNYDGTSQEAEDSIGTVIARYGYAPGFLAIYGQVGASLASLGINIPQNLKKSTSENLKNHLEKDEKILYQHANVNVNGVVRECKNGLVQGFKNAVSMLDKVQSENNLLRKENENLKAIIQNNLETGIER